MSEIDKIVEAINNTGGVTCFDWLQMIFNAVLTGLATWIAYINYKLQKKIKEDSDKEKKIESLKHVSSVYYFLNDVFHKMADTEFKYSTFNNVVVDGAKYMDDINYLRMQNITNQEFNLLRELYALYDGIKTDPKENMRNFKILYKKVIDVNINPKDIPKYKKEDNYDYLASIQFLTIMKKLESMMSNDKKTDANIKIDFNNKMYVRKKYDKDHYIENKNGIIKGNIKKYETIMHFGSSNISTSSELIYEGTIINNNIAGEGKYYYYTKSKGFANAVNSCNLKEVEINLDTIAQTIKNKMKDECPDGMFVATYEGTFEDGDIKNGILRYKFTPDEKEQEKEISN